MYYITRKNSETGKKMQELLDKASAIRKEISEYLKLVGANPNQWVSSDKYLFNTGVMAVFFDKEPDLKIWKEFKKIPNSYQPRMTSYEGKKIQAKFDSIEAIDRVDLNRIVGFGQVFQHVGFDLGSKDYFCFMLREEWKHTMPEDCEEITYKRYLELFKNE